MDDSITKSDALLLFCSPNALTSDPVQYEWKRALKLQKVVVPIFKILEHIPPQIKDERGVKFNDFDLEETVKEIHEAICNKIQKKYKME